MKNAITSWLLERPERERNTLLIGAVLLIVIVIWLLFWQPVLQDRAILNAARDNATDDLAWMMNAAVRVKALQARGRIAVNVPPEVAMTRAASRHGLTVTRMEPAGRGRVEVVLENADYAKLLRYIAELEQVGISVDRANLKRLPEPGLVAARLRLQTGA